MELKENITLPVIEEIGEGCCVQGRIPMLRSDVAEGLAGVLKALGHPVRIQIMYILAKVGGQVCVCDIERQFDIKQPTISHHLRLLREAGLVDAEQRGLYMYYRVTPEKLGFVRRHLKDLLP